MSFRCGVCLEQVEPGIKSTSVVIATRSKVYPPRLNANIFISRDEPGRKMVSDDPGGVGQEIEKEVLACPDCGNTLGEKVQ